MSSFSCLSGKVYGQVDVPTVRLLYTHHSPLLELMIRSGAGEFGEEELCGDGGGPAFTPA